LVFQHQLPIQNNDSTQGSHWMAQPVNQIFSLWSYLVQDPVISKYISITLVASLILNIFLLNMAKQARQDSVSTTTLNTNNLNTAVSNPEKMNSSTVSIPVIPTSV